MNRVKKIIGLLILSSTVMVCSADTIPDPTVQIGVPPMGLPAVGATNQLVLPVLSEGGLKVQGVLIVEDMAKSKVFISGGAYKVNDIVDDMWKVKSISRKKVVLVNIENKKEVKTFNIAGE